MTGLTEAGAKLVGDTMAYQRARIAALEAEVTSLLNSMLTIAESGDTLARSVIDAYRRNGRNVAAERSI